MNPNKIKEHIDSKILTFLNINSLIQSIYYLDDLIEKFMSRDSFIPYDEKYLVDNWVKIPIKTRYTTYYVLMCIERRAKIKWLIDNKYSRLSDINDKSKFKLILFKERIDELHIS